MVSRWEPYKGHALLVDALPLITSTTNWLVWIVGGPQRPHEAQFREQIIEQARSLNVANRIRWLGQRSEVASLLAAADIHCQPNLSPEPFGLTFVEGLAAGLTVITTRLGGGEEILSPDYGMLTTPGDVADLANALSRAIDSPELRANFAARGPARAKELCDPAIQIPLLYETLARAAGR
jgi:glycosyltransferase involved in cell wall biosynthesis